MRLTLAILVSAGLCFLAASAAQAAVEDDFDVEVVDRALGGPDQPGLIFSGIRPITNIRVTVVKAGKDELEFSRAVLNPGEVWKVTWPQAPGRALYRVDFRADGMQDWLTVNFTATVANPFDITVAESDIDLYSGRIGYSTAGNVRSATLWLFSPSDDELLKVEHRQVKAGTGHAFEFSPPDGEIGLVKLVANDDQGFSKEITFSSYSVPVPHDEVNFEFNSADIRPLEEPKLEAVLAGTVKALSTLGKQIRFKLFVAGYTDTVGSPEFNLELSRRRAAAIAGWLKDHGLRLPVCSHGFGESVLAVDTPDETPEERNRRTIFVISGQAPRGKDFHGDASWNCH